MNLINISLEDPRYAYLFGLIQSDGHLYLTTRDRGRVSIEVSKRDEAILWRVKKFLPFHSSITERVRSTNFSEQYTSVIWRVYDKRFRDHLVSCGLKSGCKSELVQLPNCLFSESDYFRGWVDGDGSLGMTAKGFPFLSLVTSSTSIAVAYVQLIQKVTGKSKCPQRNSRDNVYNIVVYKEDAQQLVNYLYYDGCLAIPRKLTKANDVINWKRPAGMRKVTNKKVWQPDEDQFILNHTIETSMEALQRSRSSIEMRLWRLKKVSNL